MALLKEIPYGKSGVNLTYHRIAGIVSDFESGDTTVSLWCYVNEATRRMPGGECLFRNMYRFPGFPQNINDPRDWAYKKLKETEDWKDAEDV